MISGRVLTLLLFVFIFSCGTETVPSYEEAKVDAVLCDYAHTDAYNLAIGKIEDSELTYFVSDDRLSSEMIAEAAAEYAAHSRVSIRQVYSKEDADIIIKVEHIDGLGGTLGKAWYPSSIFKRGKNLRPMILDEEDFFGKGRNTFDKFVILLHEWGHIFGIRHSSLKNAVMYPRYNKEHGKLKIDDILAIRDQYDNTDSFIYGGTKYIHVSKDDDTQLTQNFQAKEFATNCTDKIDEGNFISMDIVEALQRVRGEFGPIRITSSFRTEACNRNIGGATQSAHQLSQAVDFTFYNKRHLEQFREHLRKRRCIYYTLKDFGIMGMAVYDRHIHIDAMRRDNIWVSLYAGSSNLDGSGKDD